MYFGAHVSAAGGIDKAAQRAIDIKADAVQLFVQSPRMWRLVNHSDASIDEYKRLCEKGKLRTGVTHAIYLINIASADKELYKKSRDALVATMKTAERIGLDAVIFHPGSHRENTFESSLKRLAEACKKTLDVSENTWLLLENCAGAGGTIGRSIEQLEAIFDAVGDHPRLGVCVDTCHWYVSGTDVTDPKILDRELKKIDKAFGLDRLRCLHINDAKTTLGSNLDRHANIGEGTLGKGLGTVLGHPKLQGKLAILEVPGDGDGPTAAQMKKVRALHKRACALAHA